MYASGRLSRGYADLIGWAGASGASTGRHGFFSQYSSFGSFPIFWRLL